MSEHSPRTPEPTRLVRAVLLISLLPHLVLYAGFLLFVVWAAVRLWDREPVAGAVWTVSWLLFLVGFGLFITALVRKRRKTARPPHISSEDL